MSFRETLGITGNETNKNGASTFGASIGQLINQGEDLAAEHPDATKWILGLTLGFAAWSELGKIKDSLPGANTPGIGLLMTLGVGLAAFAIANGSTNFIQNKLGGAEISPGSSAAPMDRTQTTPHTTAQFQGAAQGMGVGASGAPGPGYVPPPNSGTGYAPPPQQPAQLPPGSGFALPQVS